MNLKDFKHADWVKNYDGRWSLLTSTHFGDQYTKELRYGSRPFTPRAIILVCKHRSSGWMRQTDRDILGNFLSKQITKNPALAKTISAKLKAQSKSILAFIKKHENNQPSWESYQDFWRRVASYYHVHINVKFVVDYLEPDLLKKYLPVLESARLAAEPVLIRTEDFIENFTKQLSQKSGYDFNLLLCLTKQELGLFFSKNKLPKRSELKQRYFRSALVFNEQSSKLYKGAPAKDIEHLLLSQNKSAVLKGKSAFPGKVQGIVRIVRDPNKVKTFNTGDILVTGATRPEFLPIMYKAAAFVTDAGGILSHAAITAREMKKPCIIGTQIATNSLRDGNLVEVDATNGTVKILKK